MTGRAQLRERIAFDARGTMAADGFGNTETDFVEQFIVSARVTPLIAGEQVMASRLTGKQPVIIAVRYDPERTGLIEASWRARDTEGKRIIYEILGVKNPDERNQFIELTCMDIGQRAPAPSDAAPSLDFSVAGNSGYLALLEDI